MTLASATDPSLLNPPRPALLHGVGWQTYRSLRDELDARQQRIYLTFDRGDLEMMAPLPIHERWKIIFGWLVEAIEDETGVDAYALASTTLRREDLERGLEPDACYYIQNASRIAGKNALDLTVDPPPDLAIEVDVMHRSLDREPIYAALGVAELWRYRKGRVHFLSLSSNRTYVAVDRSIAFPFLESAALEAFLPTLPAGPDRQARAFLRTWVRGRLA